MKGAAEEARRLLGTLGVPSQSMAQLCTYRVGGPAAIFVEAQSVADLQLVQHAVEETEVATLLVGRGSNLLVSDAGFDGIVVQLGSEFSSVDVDPAEAQLNCGAAALMPVAARLSAAAGLAGFEWAVGVPGSIGGGVRMNAGGHGSDIKANVVDVELFDFASGGPRTVSNTNLELAYRQSNLTSRQVVLSAKFQLGEGEPERSKQEVSEIVQWRRKHQPGGQNAGSVFRNPEGDSAGRLIEDIGLKGFRLGSAAVSDKHANFIQADPAGLADDVYALIVEVRRRVNDETGILLHPENRLIGFDQEIDADVDI